MALKLPKMARGVVLINKDGTPADAFVQWWQLVANAFDSLAGIVTAVQAAQTAATAANTAAVAANTAAATAQAAANTAQATADAIVVPPSGARTVSSNTTLTGADSTIIVNASGGPVTITLPVAATRDDPYIITKNDASANVVAITAHSGETINGAAFYNLTTQFQSSTVVSDGGTGWYAS